MGSTAATNRLLRKVLRQVERSGRRKWLLKRAIQTLNSEPDHMIYTSQGYQPIKLAARYWFMLALIWRLLDDDAAADDKLKKARACMDRKPKFEAEVLYEHATLFMQHGWRLDAVPALFERIVTLYERENEHELVAQTLTNWGKFLYGQKKYGEALDKFTDADRQWTEIQGQLGHIMSRSEKQQMMETNFALLKALVAQKADQATINQVAQKTIRYDRVMHRKFAAATTLRRITTKTSNG